MTKILKAFIPLLVFIIIAIFLWQGLKRNPHRIPSPFINKELPEFAAPSLYQPNQMITHQAFIGHVSLLNVFATWCIACHAEHPTLMDVHNKKTVPIYGLDYKDQRPAAKKWLAKYGDPYKKVLFDSNGKVGLDVGVYGTPETFVIDKKGVIRYKYIGPMSPTAWREKVLPIVKKLQQEAS